MTVILIAYEFSKGKRRAKDTLDGTELDFETREKDIQDYIQSHEHAQVGKGTYLVETGDSPVTIRDRFNAHCGKLGRLYALEVGSNWASSQGLDSGATFGDWLSQHVV